MEVALTKKRSKSALSQNECVGLHFATQYMYIKRRSHQPQLESHFGENSSKRKTFGDIRKSSKVVSGLNTAGTSKGETLFRNGICVYLWFRKQ